MVPTLGTRHCEIETISSQFQHCLHAYYGVSPWHPDGTHLTYYGMNDDEDLGYVVVQELASGEETVVGRSDRRDFHTGAWQRWCLNGRAIVYHHRTEEGGVPHVVPLDEPKRPRVLEDLKGCTIRSLGPDRIHALASSKNPDGDTAEINRVNLKTGGVETLVTSDEAVEKLPDELFSPDARWYFNHPVFNPQETVLFFKLMKRHPDDSTSFCAFFVKDVDRDEVRCFGDRISGHPFWMNDGKHILNIKSPRDGSDNRWLVLVDSGTGEDVRLADQPIEGPGHPSQSPDGRWVATDAFTADRQAAPIYLFDLTDGTCREIVRLEHSFEGGRPYDPTDIRRGQPHPTWSPDSEQLLVNCNHGGERMKLLLLKGFS